MISFKPNLPISYNPIDNVLFRIRDGGKVTLTDLYIQRSNITGSENAPIIMIISGFVQQSNAIGNNSPVQLVIDRCILEGGNFASSNVWYNLGLAETCNVGYGAAIVADGQTTVQISGSTIRTFEGPAVRALNGASVTIDKNTFLDNNGQRNRNTLSSMQTNVVCEGGNGVTTVNIALDNVASVTSTGNGWIFSSSDNSCIVKATFNDQPALPRSLPQTNSAQITVNNTNQLAEVVIRGKFLEPCMRRLILEIHEKNKVDVGVIFEFDVESSSFTVNWIDSENINFQFPSSLLQDLNSSIKWEIGIYESGKREQTNWLSIEPEQIRPDEDEEKQKKTNPVVGIVVPIVVVIIVAIIIIVVIALYVRNKNLGQQSKQFRSESNANMSDIEVTSNNEIAKDEQQEQNAQNQQKHKELTQVSTPFFKESDTEQKVSSDPIISRDYEPNKKQDQIKQQLERQNDIKQESSSKNSHRSKLHQSIRSDTYLTKKDREIQKYELNKKTKEQIQKSKDSRKSSKPRNGSSYRQKNRFNNEKRRQQINFNSEKKRRKSLSLESSTNTTSSNDSSDSDSTSFTLHSSDTDDQKQSSSSIQTQDANELKVMEVLQKKKEMKNKDQQKQQSDNKKTYKQKGQIKEKNMKKKEGDSQKYEDKIAEEDILYQEGDSSPQPSDIDKSSFSTLTSSDPEDKDHKKKSSQKNKKNTKQAKQKPNSSKKEKPKTKTQKGNHSKSKNRNSKPTEPTESNNNPQLNDINNQLDSDSAFPPPVTILDFDESKLVIQRDAHNQPVDIKPSQIYTQTSSIEKSLNQSSDSRPPLLEGLVVDFQGNSKREVV
ncbi:MAG: hypothetical protein EZS28_034457 [Streblomastix strix]|uniref:Right handed beta helix domain-containing protein n=1 Tax=Streblomastix strix TaxID=222440 RepID=A0A5J4UGU0_9EUKA|nr:MAG: hypothetical protein EZS28_034457 [Streblomastix strix]